jgi:spermidine synthase/MFS family permease
MIRPIALLLTVLTGFSGLVYQVAWQKYLAILLGSQSEAVAAVLAIFLGGLAAGYALFGRVTRRFVERARARGEAPRLLRLYALVESGIGVYALLFPFLFSLAQALSVHIPHFGESVNFACDVLLTVLLIAPPTILMGGTIPVLTQALSARLDEATRVHAWVYSFNTAGAFFGALLGAFVLIPQFGLDGVVRVMGGVNLLAGTIFFALGRRPQPALPELTAAAPDAAPQRFAGYAIVVLLSGFAMMCIQTTLNRIGALSLGASHFTFAMVVAVFVLCIALGSFAVSALRSIPPLLIVASQWLLVALLALLYFELENAPYYVHVVRSLFVNLPAGFYPYHFFVFLGILGVLCVPIGLSGALLPLVFHHLRNELGGLGGVAGRLYAWNTLGSLLGALLGGYALLFFIDLQQVFVIALCALVVGASLLSVLVLRIPVLAAALAASLALGACLLLPPWDPFRMSAGLFRQRGALPQTFAGADALFESRRAGTRILFHDDDPTSTVTVADGNSRSLITNGKPDGNLRYDYTTMAMVGLVPALLCDEPSRAFVIGWGLGVTSGVLGSLDDVKEVVAVEISPAVLEAAPFFAEGNQNAARNPKIHAIRSDAYRALLRSEGQFNVIASEPSNPWVMGVEMLFSEEFLRVARDRLTPGGVYAQWFHLYEVDDETWSIVLRTFKAVFGDVAIWYTRGPDVLILGFKSPSPELDVQRLKERFARADFRAGFERAEVRSWAQLLAHEVLPLGAVGATDMPGPLHSLRHPILSDSAARAFFAGGSAVLPRMPSEAASRAGAKGSLLVKELAGKEPSEDLLEELARHTCAMARPTECEVVMARWTASHPDSPRLARATSEMRLADFTGTLTNAPLPTATIAALVELYHGHALIDSESPGPVRNAALTSNLYVRDFHYAFPFDREAVRRAWSACASDPRTVVACTQARRVAERKLGPLYTANAGPDAAPPTAAVPSEAAHLP